MEQEFYRGLAQRVRVLADKADPFTRRRLLELAKRYDAKGGTSRSRPAERPLAGAAYDAAGIDLLRTGRALTGPPVRSPSGAPARTAFG